MASERIKNTKRNILMGFMARILDLIFPFIINTVVIKTLGVEYLGLNSLFASILQVLSLAELGVGFALVFSMYDPIAKGDTVKVCALLKLYRNVYLTIGSVIVIAGLVCMPFLDNLISGDVPSGINIYILFIISLTNTSVSYFLFSYRTSLLQASQRIDIRDGITMITNFLLNLSKILILVITGDYYLFCIAVPVFTVVNNLLIWIITKRRYPEYKCEGSISKEEKKEIKKRISGLFINKIGDVVCNSFDSIVISGFLGLTILGKFNNYYFVMNALMTLMGIFLASAIPSIGNSIVTETKEKNYRDFSTLQFGFSWFTGWVSICLLCLYQPFIEIWIGKDMLMDTDIVFLFGIYLYFAKSSEVFMAYRQAAGIWAKDRLRPVAEASINLVLNIVLVKYLGVSGVLLSTIFTLGIIHFVWGSYYLFKEYFTEYSQMKYMLTLLYYFIITVGAGILTYYICSLIEFESLIVCIIVRGSICMVIPNIIFFVIFCRRPEFKNIIAIIKGMVLKK